MMKKAASFVALLLLLTTSCTQKVKNEIADQENVITASNENSVTAAEFDKYLESLEELELPLSLDSLSDYQKHSINHNKELFLKFKHKWALSPYGVLFRDDGIAAVLYVTVGDALVPIIATYNEQGKIISQLNPYQKSGDDIGYHSTEYAWMTADKHILVVDSTITYDLNESKDNILPETRKLSIDTMVYVIGDDGVISSER